MRVGVVMAVGGFSPYLAEALDAVLAQAPVAVVVVDDGAPEPLTLHPDHAPGCTLVRRTERGGPAAARADGLAALRADVDAVAVCDSDDAWEPGLLDALTAGLEADARAGLCFGRASIVGADGRPTGERWAEPPAGALTDAVTVLYSRNPIPTSSVLLRRSALEAVGGFAAPDVRAEDWDLWLRVARGGFSLRCIPEARIRYRRHPGSLTGDVAALARAQMALHERHGDAVAPKVRKAALRSDRRALRRANIKRA